MLMETMDILNFNWWAKTHIVDESKFDDNGNIIMENNTNYKNTGILAKIFSENWDKYYSIYKQKIDEVRPNANDEVKKVIACANHELGASVYVCPNDDEVYFCHHTCKGKLCSSCGVKSQNIEMQNILNRCITSPHRHITFTIPTILTHWFFDNLKDTNLLFDSACETLYSVVNGKVKKCRIYDLKYKPGFFAFLHTFGRPLNFNPHIHIIFAENVIHNGNFKKISYLDYNALSKRFMKILLDKMEKRFGKNKFRGTKNEMYQKYPNGFYVNNKLEDDGIKFDDIEKLIKYVTRYCARPVIAESRILSYDGKQVKWCYTDHKENKYHEIVECVFSFITKIIKHLLPYKFKSIRSYGYYNKPSKLPNDTNMLISNEQKTIRKTLTNWKNLILTSFKRIPIKCPKCGTLMNLCFNVIT